MEVSSKYVGARGLPLEVSLTPRQTMNYAAGYYDANPWYFDDEREGGIVAPPMLAVALTWALSADFKRFWPDQDFPEEALAQQVHFTEHLYWHRPMRPGDTLRITGEVAAIIPHLAGTQLIIRYDAVDPKGEAVFTEHIGGMLRDVKCADAGQGKDTLPTVPRGPRKGEPQWEAVHHINPLDAHIYDGCGDISFPIHTSPAFAHQVGLPDPIYLGTATLARAVKEVINREADGDPTRLRALDCMFTGMVMMNTDIRIQLNGREETDAGTWQFFTVLNADDKKAIRNGAALIA